MVNFLKKHGVLVVFGLALVMVGTAGAHNYDGFCGAKSCPMPEKAPDACPGVCADCTLENCVYTEETACGKSMDRGACPKSAQGSGCCAECTCEQCPCEDGEKCTDCPCAENCPKMKQDGACPKMNHGGGKCGR